MEYERWLQIGEVFVGQSSEVVYTLLGSCISVCLFDSDLKIGGINHILLPGRAHTVVSPEAACKYGQNAMDSLVNKMRRLGGTVRRMRAKVFGGANMFSSIPMENDMGEKNAVFVFEYLRRAGIRIAARDLGGFKPRKLFFYTDTGDVFIKRMPGRYAHLGASRPRPGHPLTDSCRVSGIPEVGVPVGGGTTVPTIIT